MCGGLGNQLFQLSTALKLRQSIASNQSILINFAGEKYAANRVLAFEPLFEIPSWLLFEPVSLRDQLLKYSSVHLRVGRYTWNAYNDVFRFIPFPSSDIFLDGYFWRKFDKPSANSFFPQLNLQSLKFDRSWLRFLRNTVAVHIRGGDFISHQKFNVCGYQYYKEAISIAIAKGFDDFIIVSDDQKHAAMLMNQILDEMPRITYQFLPSSSPLSDFNFLRQMPCKILSNSTYSWWSSALSIAPKITIVPSHLALGLQRPRQLHEDIIYLY
ncbi:alpha-1,2-fucosyltransferase [Synechococcus sp. CC9311]|uniref:alpha-1,2-fucosyltransferase n=1 Tax=Synechococcus sp. (strain CC9311) TaxID=64471 RepID=UPI0002F51CAE|nr:alpha-1,2-fucosyltransferase [Synechococcus sp. CC9311]